MKRNRLMIAGLCAALGFSLPIGALAGALAPFGSLATVGGGGVGDTDFHVASMQASFAQITFNAGSAADSHAVASAAVNALDASATSFDAPRVRAWAEFEDTFTISAPAGVTVVPIAIGLSFSPNLKVLAGGDVFGYAYADKVSQVSVTGLGTGFFDTLIAIDCLSSVEPGASISDPCIGVGPSTNKTSATMLIPVGMVGIDALIVPEAGSAPGCAVDSDGNVDCNSAIGSFAEAADPFRISLTALIPGVQILSQGGASYAAISSSVPEPATLLLFGVGLAGLAYSRRKRAGN